MNDVDYETKNNEIKRCNKEPICITNSAGIKKWYLNGQLHRIDGPAVINPDGGREWYYYGNLHRMRDKPAVVDGYGVQKWYNHGQLHRDNGPAIRNTITGLSEEWYQHGKLHRIGGPAKYYGNVEEWYFRGKLHRVGGPARFHWYGTCIWYLHGEIHREDGPAIVKPGESDDNDIDIDQWYLFDRPYMEIIIDIVITMLPLNLPPYVLLWILQLSHPGIKLVSEIKLVALLEGMYNSRERIKETTKNANLSL